MVTALGMLLCGLGMLACAEGTADGGPANSPAGDSGTDLGKRFTVAMGESVTVTGAELRVTYAELVDDSRCPPDVTCVWEGDASVRLSLAMPGSAEPGEATLHTYHRRPGHTDYAGFRVELVDLSTDGDTATLVVTG